MHFRRNQLAFISILLTIFTLNSCRREPDLSNYPVVSFSNEVLPIISGNCTQSGCHGGSGEVFNLTNYNEVMGIVQPRKAYKSSLYTTITGKSTTFMPPTPASALTEDQIRTIFVWIEQGAPNN